MQSKYKASADGGRVPLVQKEGIHRDKQNEIMEIKCHAFDQHEILMLQNSSRSQFPTCWIREFVEGLHSITSDLYDATLLIDVLGENIVEMVRIEDFNAVR